MLQRDFSHKTPHIETDICTDLLSIGLGRGKSNEDSVIFKMIYSTMNLLD